MTLHTLIMKEFNILYLDTDSYHTKNNYQNNINKHIYKTNNTQPLKFNNNKDNSSSRSYSLESSENKDNIALKNCFEEPKRTYFISYTNRTLEDVSWAKWTEWVLREIIGGTTIMQEYDFQLGDNFKERMHMALKSADVVVCVLTRTYMESIYCIEEWSNTERFIPVKFDDCKPEGLLKSRVYIDLYGLSREEAKKKLVAALQGTTRPKTEPEFPASPSFGQKNLCQVSQVKLNNLPVRNPDFTGREEVLEKISKGLTNFSRVIVVGAGGLGKSQLAFEYAHRHAADYQCIWVVNATSKTSLERSYRRFATRTGLPSAETDAFEHVLNHVVWWLEEHARFLFILDNAEGISNLYEYLPAGQLCGHVLINTRDAKHGIAGEEINVGVFSMEDSVAFLQKRLENTSKISRDDAQSLASMLDCLPLALEQAAAYMIVNEYTSCTQYLELLEKFGLEVLNERVLTIDGESAKTVATTWKVSIEQIPAESAARQLFNLCAYFAPDQIPLSMLIEGHKELPLPLQEVLALGNKHKHNALVGELTRYSLITLKRDDKGNALLSMHRIIQQVMRYSLAQANDERWLSCCLNLACAVFKYGHGTFKSMITFMQKVPHVLEIIRQFEGKSVDDEILKKIALLCNEAGRGFEYDGKYDEALKWLKQALDSREKIVGTEHPETATTYYNIARVCYRQGKYTDALKWYTKALTIREKTLGTKHPDTAVTYHYIARVYYRQGKYTDALKWYTKALTIREKTLGTKHPYTATTSNGIAEVYYRQGEYAKALELHMRALAIRKKSLHVEHPNTAATYHDIARVYYRQRNYGEALEWYNKALAIRRKMLGMEHPYTATTSNGIAEVYYRQENYTEALEWHMRALAIRKKMLSAEHPDTATTYYNIARVYYRQENYTEALEWYTKALAIREKVLGTEHPETAITSNGIAEVYYRQENYTKALEWSLKSYKILKKLGTTHPNITLVKSNLEEAYTSAGFTEPFEDWLKKNT